MPEKEKLSEKIEAVLPEGEEAQKGKWELRFKELGMAVTLLTLAWGILQFKFERDADREKQAEEHRTDAEKRTLEIKAPFRQKQMETYMETCDCASKIAWLDEKDPERTKAYNRFVELYLGQLRVVEDKEVDESSYEFYRYASPLQTDVVDVGKRLATRDMITLSKKAQELANACRKDMSNTWNVSDTNGGLPVREN